MANSKATTTQPAVLAQLRAGTVIPAHPLALTAARQLDERYQRALSRYYIASGAGGLAVGVHTTQFAIHYPEVGLLRPVLALAAEEMNRADADRDVPLIRIAGICGHTHQSICEADEARELGYTLGLISLAALRGQSIGDLIDHCRVVASTIDLFGFYLQPAVGGVELPYKFWRCFCEIENVRAIKIAAFDRYRTLSVIRAVADSGRNDIALYTGNDDNIVMDLLTPYRFVVNGRPIERRIVGGLLGHWSVWTQKAVQLLDECHRLIAAGGDVPAEMLRRNIEVTDSNAAFFDAANAFAGCIAGLHEVLRRQGLLEGVWCLNPNETFGPGQLAQIDRVYAAYPHLNDDDFISQHRGQWLTR